MVFSVFEDGGHSIYMLEEAKIVAAGAAGGHTDGRQCCRAARSQGGDVQALLATPRAACRRHEAARPAERYTGGLKLDAIGQPTVTAGVSGWGGYVSGGMSALFSDMLGDRMLGVAVQAAGRWTISAAS